MFWTHNTSYTQNKKSSDNSGAQGPGDWFTPDIYITSSRASVRLQIKKMKKKIKYVRKRQSSSLCKGQDLPQVWWDEWDVKHFSTLHTAKTVETEEKNWNGKKLNQK